MRRCRIGMLALAVVALAGCRNDPRNVDDPTLRTPVEIRLGEPGSASGPVRIRSGQMIALPLCCPPVELRDAKGRVAQELDASSREQRLVAAPGTYTLVGHDPAGEERVLRVEVDED